jgi:hypothetical protein
LVDILAASGKLLYYGKPNGKERNLMDLKLNNLEAVAVMNALTRYQKDLEKMGDEKGINIERKTIKDLLNRMEDMAPGEVP